MSCAAMLFGKIDPQQFHRLSPLLFITLFQIEKNAIELIKNKNIIQNLEDTTDRAKDISDCFKTIIVKS